MNRTATTRTRLNSPTILATALALIVAAAPPVAAQEPDPTATGHPPTQERPAGAPDAPVPGTDAIAEQREAIARLGHWIGEWEGSGWAVSRAGRDEFTIRESVQSKLGGLALLVQGTGKSKHPETGEETVTHDALAVVTWDPEGDRYVFQHYTANGRHGQAELIPTDEGWRWGFRDPHSGVDVRFTAEIGEETWHERGEVSLDGGTTWRPMLEMELRRVGG